LGTETIAVRQRGVNGMSKPVEQYKQHKRVKELIAQMKFAY
jgi:hypothetical protein